MTVPDFLKRLLDGAEVVWMPLGEVVKPIAPPAKLKREAYCQTGATPIIDQGALFIAGYTDENVKALPADEYVIFGDHSEHIKYVDFSFIQGADGLKILKPNLGNARYIYHVFQNFYKKKLTYKRHWSEAKETLIPIPCPEKSKKFLEFQAEIVRILDQWDTAIEKTEALIDAKERQFRWLRSKLLLKNPNAKHWKTETLGHYIEEKKDKSTVPDLHPCLTSSRRGMFLQDEYFSKQVASKDNTGYKIMSRGDFTYRSMSDDDTFVFNKQDIVDKGLISPAYGVFAPNKHMDADFLYYFLNSSAFKRALAGEIQGGTRTALKLNALKKLDIDIPELPEQQAIAHKINTAQQEINLLKKLANQYREQKRDLMQKLLSGEWRIEHKEAVSCHNTP